MITQKTILKNLRCSKRSIGKSHCTSGDEFRVTVTRKDTGKKMTFSFYDNYENNAKLTWMLECLIMDRRAFIDYRRFEEFCWAFGYDIDKPESRKVYQGCKEESKKLSEFFTRRELEVLNEYYC